MNIGCPCASRAIAAASTGPFDHRGRERDRVIDLKTTECDLLDVRETIDERRSLRPTRRHDEQHRRARRRQQVREQRAGVGVGPLRVVDQQRERLLACNRVEHVAEHAGGDAARIVERELLAAVWSDDLREHREQPAQLGGIAAAQRLERARRQPIGMARHDPREPVDDAVERLERHRLALVAAARRARRTGRRPTRPVKRRTSAVLPTPGSPSKYTATCAARLLCCRAAPGASSRARDRAR